MSATSPVTSAGTWVSAEFQRRRSSRRQGGSPDHAPDRPTMLRAGPSPARPRAPRPAAAARPDRTTRTLVETRWSAAAGDINACTRASRCIRFWASGGSPGHRTPPPVELAAPPAPARRPPQRRPPCGEDHDHEGHAAPGHPRGRNGPSTLGHAPSPQASTHPDSRGGRRARGKSGRTGEVTGMSAEAAARRWAARTPRPLRGSVGLVPEQRLQSRLDHLEVARLGRPPRTPHPRSRSSDFCSRARNKSLCRRTNATRQHLDAQQGPSANARHGRTARHGMVGSARSGR